MTHLFFRIWWSTIVIYLWHVIALISWFFCVVIATLGWVSRWLLPLYIFLFILAIINTYKDVKKNAGPYGI